MDGIITGPAITVGIDAMPLGLSFATVEAGTYHIGGGPYALPEQEVVTEAFGIGTTQFTNKQLRTVLEQLGPKNTVLMGELPDGTMKLLARGTEEEIKAMSSEDKEEAVRNSITSADLHNVEGGLAAFDLQSFLTDVNTRGPVVLKDRSDKFVSFSTVMASITRCIFRPEPACLHGQLG